MPEPGEHGLGVPEVAAVELRLVALEDDEAGRGLHRPLQLRPRALDQEELLHHGRLHPQVSLDQSCKQTVG